MDQDQLDLKLTLHTLTTGKHLTISILLRSYLTSVALPTCLNFLPAICKIVRGIQEICIGSMFPQVSRKSEEQPLTARIHHNG